MAIYLSRKKGGTVATPITPSNSSPVALTADTPVNPTGNGYAIASYNTKTPSNSSPVALTSGEIDKIGGNGYAIESYSSITPSNSSPATITSGSIYKASSNGKAVASVTNVTPSSTPTSVSANDVVKIGGSGVIVDSIPTPTSITPSNWSPAEMTTGNAYTPSANALAIEYGKLQQATPSNSSPVSVSGGIAYNIGPSSSASGYLIESYSNLAPSNSSPATITSGDIYKATASGKAVASVTDITPSNSSPVSLSSGSIYKPSSSGYAISSYSSKTPSDSSPASVSSGAIIKASASGYLYSSSGLGKCKSGTFTSSTSSQTINLGFQPKYILIMSSALTTNIFDYSYSSTKGIYATANAGATEYTISGNTSNNHISAITSTGFTFNKSGSSGTTIYYFAMA